MIGYYTIIYSYIFQLIVARVEALKHLCDINFCLLVVSYTKSIKSLFFRKFYNKLDIVKSGKIKSVYGLEYICKPTGQ